jgi:ketosteroid isomerase-like protein
MIRPAVHAFALVALIACGGAGQCPQGPSAAEPEALTEQLRTVEEWRAAWETRGADTIMKLYDHGAAVTLVTQGVALVGWDLVQTELQQRLARATKIHYALSDVRVAPAGTSVVVTAALAREITEGAATASDTGTLTLVLTRDGARWVVLAEHFSFRPQA